MSLRTTRRSFSLSKSLKRLKTVRTERFRCRNRSHAVAGDNAGDSESVGLDSVSDRLSWSDIPTEILGEIIKRVEEREQRRRIKRSVVMVCASVCKRWREAAIEIVGSPLQSGKITFASCLKQPGPHNSLLQCVIIRNKKNSTFYLHTAIDPSLTYKGKLLLAARMYRCGAHTEYIISLDADDLSQGSKAYVVKISSDLLGTNFTIYDNKPLHRGAKPSSTRALLRFTSKQISPHVAVRNYKVGQVCYKFNILKKKVPRKLTCSLKTHDSPKSKKQESAASRYMVLRNKAPRWHDHLCCWCLDFHGRVNVASVKNFQLVATVDQSQPGGKGDEEAVVLQFGKVGDDTFVMDYRQPLSAFHAFAICLSGFGATRL